MFCDERKQLLEPLPGATAPPDSPAGASGASGLSEGATTPPGFPRLAPPARRRRQSGGSGGTVAPSRRGSR
eukprot:13405916-Alexandrium_andersonii.AAC.1